MFCVAHLPVKQDIKTKFPYFPFWTYMFKKRNREKRDIYEGFYNFRHQHCPHLVIFIIEYLDLFWLHKCNEWSLFYNIAILQLKKFKHKCVFWKKYYVNLGNFSQKALSHILNPTWTGDLFKTSCIIYYIFFCCNGSAQHYL